MGDAVDTWRSKGQPRLWAMITQGGLGAFEVRRRGRADGDGRRPGPSTSPSAPLADAQARSGHRTAAARGGTGRRFNFDVETQKVVVSRLQVVGTEQ
jgi:hypothetical protein